MRLDDDLQPGQFFRFPRESREKLYVLKGRKRDGSIVLVDEQTEKKRLFDPLKFRDMRTDGRAVRVRQTSSGRAVLKTDIDPYALLDDEEPGISLSQRSARRRARKKLDEARTLWFYAKKFDELGDVSKSKQGLDELIDDHYDEAVSQGLSWKVSDSALRKALARYGTPGDRPLEAFLERGSHQQTSQWPQATLALKERMVSAYWSDRRLRPIDAFATFFGEFDKENHRRMALGEMEMKRPDKETLRNWIKAAANYENYCRRNGEKAARRRFLGRGRGMGATRALQYVMFDHTRVDAFAVLKDEDGNDLIVERPWLTLAIDVHTRAVVGAVLGFEPPSIYSVMLCLRQVVKPKRFLEDEFGEYKGATDCWGKPNTIIVDNGWEFVGKSFQVCCEAAGINVIWAPVKKPEYKAIVERSFETFNQHVWHRLPGAVPYKPHEMAARELDAKADASFTIDELEDRFWRAVVTIYHVEVHSGIELAPARAWNKSIREAGRPMIDDVGSLDKLLGVSQTCQLSAEGIFIQGHRFHDKEVTSRLLGDLAKHGRARNQRKAPLSSATVIVMVTIDPSNCGRIHVWNPETRTNEPLPNVDRRFTDECSWREAKLTKEFAQQKNLAFHSDEDKYRARLAHLESLKKDLTEKPYKEARKLIRSYKPPTPAIVTGETVLTANAEPTWHGLGPLEIPMSIPARERSDDRIPPKGPRRGGATATKKAVATRKRKADQRKTERERVANASESDQPNLKPCRNGETVTVVEIGDAETLLDALEADLD